VRTLRGASVALLEARMSRELADIVTRYGGSPHSVPAVREAPLPPSDQITVFLDRLCHGAFSLVIFLTGVGVTTLLREAERLGQLGETVGALRRTRIACRGPKPVAALRRHAVPVHLTTGDPCTTTELLHTLQAIDLTGAAVALVHYGERYAPLASALRERGARLEEICLYEWLLPETLEPLRALVADVIGGRMDAVAFTSQVQCRHLFQIAGDMGQADELTDALNTRTTVAVIGPVCRAALKEHGVTPRVMPAVPKMQPLIAALAEYLDLTSPSTSEP
jgi:uroporphyrinogen-III synthase